MDTQPDKPKPHTLARIAAAISALLLLIIIGTLAFHRLEHWTWIQSFYFTVSTLATVGYGDLHPTSDGTRLFAALFILVGVGVAVAALGILGSGYLNYRAQQIVKDRELQKRS